MRLFTCGLSRDERGGLGRVYKYPAACSLSSSFLYPLSLSQISTSLFQNSPLHSRMSFFFFVFQKPKHWGHVCLLYLSPGGYDRNWDIAQRCGLLSLSLLSQNHQKSTSPRLCVPVSLSVSKPLKCTSATSKRQILNSMCFLALSLLSQKHKKQ